MIIFNYTKKCFFLGGIFVKKIKAFFKGVSNERKTVRWSDGKTLFKYSCITLLMLVFIGLFSNTPGNK